MELSWAKVEIRRESNANTISGLEALSDLEGRFVYVIETPRNLAIRYSEGISNVCYIGRQGDRSRGNRLYAHGRGWIARHLILTHSSEAFIIHYCHPRRRNMPQAYRDIEAFLINDFAETFGSAPLFNRRGERELGSYEIAVNSTIFRRRNKNTKWSIDGRRNIESDVLGVE